MGFRAIPYNQPEYPLKGSADYAAGTVSGFNMIYVGEAREGVAKSGAGWRIKKFVYDANDNMIDWNYPQSGGLESSEFDFIWDSRASYVYGV